MGGHATTRIDGQLVRFGDLLRVELSDYPNGTRWISAIFREVSDCGDIWMECLTEDESVRGDSVFSDHYEEVYSVRFGCHQDDPCLFVGDGI